MDIVRSTMSEALKRLERLDVVKRASRVAGIPLSDGGSRAVQETSGLESDRLRVILDALSPTQRNLICRGLGRLAEACRAAVFTSEPSGSIP